MRIEIEARDLRDGDVFIIPANEHYPEHGFTVYALGRDDYYGDVEWTWEESPHHLHHASPNRRMVVERDS